MGCHDRFLPFLTAGSGAWELVVDKIGDFTINWIIHVNPEILRSRLKLPTGNKDFQLLLYLIADAAKFGQA